MIHRAKQDKVCRITQYARYKDTLTEKNVADKLGKDSLARKSFFFFFSFLLHRRFAVHILLSSRNKKPLELGYGKITETANEKVRKKQNPNLGQTVRNRSNKPSCYNITNE